MTCVSGKISYASPGEAQSVIARFKARGRKGFQRGVPGSGKTQNYHCRICNQWHIGHGIRKVRS